MLLILSLSMLLLLGRGIGEETQSERYVTIKTISYSRLRLEMCASSDNIETCGTWSSYPSLYNCTSHFYVHSINKDTNKRVHSNMQSFFQTWNQYKCNCYAEGPATGTVTTTFIATVLVGILLLLFILTTIGWIWTCKIAIKRGKLLKKKENAIPLSPNTAYSVHSIPAEDQIPEATYYATTSLIKS